jgi:hypothetical protein
LHGCFNPQPASERHVTRHRRHRFTRAADWGIITNLPFHRHTQKGHYSMKHRFIWASALALAVIASSQTQTQGLTNAVILITTRAPQDTAAGSEYFTDEKGPGMVSPGDVAMVEVLGNHGYTCRLVLDRLINGAAQAWATTPPGPDTWLVPVAPDFAPMLIIESGSSSGADVPPRNTNGIPVMIGEHTDLSDRSNPGSVFMYSNGGQSTDPNQGTGASRYMKVINTTHPIMQGIPLDAQGRVKIFRDPYPEENAHVPPNGKPNYEYRWCSIPASNAAPGTTVLGVLDGNLTMSVFAVVETNGILAFNSLLGYAATNDARLVHLFANEQGSGGPRRVFSTLTDLGRVLFVRAAKWAMGESLQPYQPLGPVQVSIITPSQIQLTWQGSADRNYKILGTSNLAGSFDFSNWQTVVEDIPGTNGTVSAKLDISHGPQYAFLRVAPMP